MCVCVCVCVCVFVCVCVCVCVWKFEETKHSEDDFISSWIFANDKYFVLFFLYKTIIWAILMCDVSTELYSIFEHISFTNFYFNWVAKHPFYSYSNRMKEPF